MGVAWHNNLANETIAQFTYELVAAFNTHHTLLIIGKALFAKCRCSINRKLSLLSFSQYSNSLQSFGIVELKLFFQFRRNIKCNG